MAITYSKSARRCNFIHAASNVLRLEYSIYIPMKTLDSIIGDAMEYEWAEKVEYDPSMRTMDTASEAQILDLVAFHYLGQYWPCYGDRDNIGEFHSKLTQAIEDNSE